MAKVKVMYDKVGGTLTIFFGEPADSQICEETDHDLILIKNEKTDEVIGIELFCFRPKDKDSLTIESKIFNPIL